MGLEGRERLPRLPLEEEIANVTPRLRAVGEILDPDRISGLMPLQSDGRDAHFLSGTEKCSVSLLHAHCRTYLFRVRPARRGVSHRHNLLCPAYHPFPLVFFCSFLHSERAIRG